MEVKRRIQKLQAKRILHFQALIDPINAGFPFVIDAKIKLQNVTETDLNNFIRYLKTHPRVIDLLSASGDWDITCVFIAKDAVEVKKFIVETRKEFSSLIADWNSALILKVYKFEEYSLV